MPNAYELSKLDPATFQHLVNLLIMRVLGNGATGFSPGPDGGRDAYFEGEAQYPSVEEHWNGIWFVQCKFHTLNQSTNHQRWFMKELKSEFELFSKPDSKRRQPDNYIVATNIDLTGVADTGTFDAGQRLAKESGLKFQDHFHVWGGQKILDLLTQFPDVANYYFDFLTPGQALAAIRDGVLEDRANFEHILRHLVVTNFTDEQYLKLEQAGYATDARPGIESLFVDLPFVTPDFEFKGMVEETLARATAQNHRIDYAFQAQGTWKNWLRNPARSRIWFIKGGPGRGESTLTQFICQINRAKIILDNAIQISPALTMPVSNVQAKAKTLGLWPLEPRIPVSVELRLFAQWLSGSKAESSTTILAYLTSTIGKRLGITVHSGTLLKAFGAGRWIFVFDGLDEVPSDVKDIVAEAVSYFIDDLLVGQNADAFSICTSRPQGYSGQFATIGPTNINLVDLTPEQALNCAAPILGINRSVDESALSLQTLRDSIQSPAVRAIMTTPLQSHIMAVVVRDGGKPPERKWQLFSNFYNVMRKREANKTHGDFRLARLLREGDQLIKAFHNRLGFELHARAETSRGAQTSLDRGTLRKLVDETVRTLLDQDIEETIETLMDATLDRLVLVNTPESGEEVRFDIRPLQEFFAAEYIYEKTSVEVLQARLRICAPDSHWREVMHFLISGIVENSRVSETSIAVSVLYEINERTERSDARLINKRLALGSIIAASLLGESVLEQDKRVRSQFKEPMRTLFGSTDALIYFSTPLGSNSAAWLKDVLVDHLIEHSEAEAIGAASIIAFEVDNADERLAAILRILQNASPDFQSTLIELVNQSSIRVHFPDGQLDRIKIPNNWFAIFCFGLLLTDDWYRLGRQGITSALQIIKDAELSIDGICNALKIDLRLARLLSQMLSGDLDRNAMDNHVVFTRAVGPYQAEYIRLDPSSTYLSWTDDEWKALREAGGLFSLFYAIFKLARDRNPEDVIELRKILSSCPELLQPHHLISRLLPRSLVLGILPSKKQIQSYFEKQAFSSLRSLQPLYRKQEAASLDLNELITHETLIALDLLLRPMSFLRDTSELADSLTQDNRDTLVACLASNIGILFANANRLPEIFSLDPRIRGLIQKPVKDLDLPEPRLFDDSCEAFELELPLEANYLPQMVNLLFLITFSRHFSRSRHVRSHFIREVNIPDFIAKSIADPRDLLSLFDDNSNNPIIRASSAAIYLRHPKALAERRFICADFLGNVVDCPFDWLVRAAAFALDQDVLNFDPSALRVVNKLLEKNISDLKVRFALEPILRSWREASWAAVTSSTRDGKWS